MAKHLSVVKMRGPLGCVMVLGAIFAALGAAPAAAKPGHGAHLRLAWLANDPANTYDNATLAGIGDVAHKSGGTVDPFYAGFDPSTQLAQCDDAAASGSYDALIIEAADPIGIEPCVEAARKAGIPVAAIDLPIGPDQTTVKPQVPGEVAASFITASRFGEGVSMIIPEVCSGLLSCNIFYVAGVESFPFDQHGLGAVQAAEASNPSIHLVGHAEALYDTAIARQVIDIGLRAHPEVNVVIASGDQMALGAEQASHDTGVSVRIVGGGAGASAIVAVRAGRWFATFDALPRTEGRLGAHLLVHALTHRRAVPTGIDPIDFAGLPAWWTKATLAQHPDFTAEWPGP